MTNGNEPLMGRITVTPINLERRVEQLEKLVRRRHNLLVDMNDQARALGKVTLRLLERVLKLER